MPDLTPREREIVQLLAEGNSSKQVASRLSLSVKTVETHRTNIMRKLKLHSVSELVLYAIKNGSVQESVRGPDFTRGWVLSLPGSPPSDAVGMWEPAFDAGFQAPGKGCGKSGLGLSTVDPARHFHSELTDSAHLGEKRPSGTP